MCLAVPVKVQELLDNNKAKVEVGGVKLEASTILVNDLKVNDYVLVHAGFIIEKISDEDAQDKLDLWKEYREKTSK